MTITITLPPPGSHCDSPDNCGECEHWGRDPRYAETQYRRSVISSLTDKLWEMGWYAEARRINAAFGWKENWVSSERIPE